MLQSTTGPQPRPTTGTNKPTRGQCQYRHCSSTGVFELHWQKEVEKTAEIVAPMKRGQRARTRKKKSKATDRNAMNGGQGQMFENLLYPVIVCSGAAGSVFPLGWATQAALVTGEAYGRNYTAANGSAVNNKGEKVVSMVTQEGQLKNLRFQACDITRPLASVAKIVGAWHAVVFGTSWNGGSYIMNFETNEETELTQKDGGSVLDAVVSPTGWQARPSFGGQGR